jgi:hypothetical protein
MINLQITKAITNERYEEQMEAYSKELYRGYMFENKRMNEEPRLVIVQNLCNVTITEDQWEAIRKEIIKEF